MKLKQYQPTLRTNVPEAEKWIDKIVAPSNNQIKRMTTALQNQLSYRDNFNAEVLDLKIWHDDESTTGWSEIELNSLKGKPEGVQLIFWDWDDYAHIKWKIKAINKIQIKVKFDTDPEQEVDIRILVVGR